MKIKLIKLIALALYYGFAYFLPDSCCPIVGRVSNKIRVMLCKRIFKKCGKIATINRKASFGSGKNIEIGDNSGLGANCEIPSDIIIGNDVMMGQNVRILMRNHSFTRIDIPMRMQGFTANKQTIIEDDCWIGRDAKFTPGRHLRKGTIVAMGAIVTKDFPPYSIIGGNPAKIIRNRS